MDNEEAWMFYRDDVLEKIDRLNAVLKTSESVCSAVGFKLAKSWQEKTNELPKMPWTSIFLTSLELDVLVTIFRAVSCTFYITDPVVLNGKTLGPIRGVRKDEEPIDLGMIINDIQIELCL